MFDKLSFALVGVMLVSRTLWMVHKVVTQRVVGETVFANRLGGCGQGMRSRRVSMVVQPCASLVSAGYRAGNANVHRCLPEARRHQQERV